MPKAELYDGTVLDFEEGTPDDVIERVARQQTEQLRTAEARKPLPDGVAPSAAGGGRGSVNPPTASEPQPPVQQAPTQPPTAAQQPQQPWRIGGRGTAPVKAPPTEDQRLLVDLESPPGAGGYTASQIEEGTIAPDRLERLRQERQWAAKGIPEAKPMPWAQEKAAEIRDYTKNPIARGAIAGFSGLGQVGVGATRLAADLVGAESVADFAAATSRTAGDIGGGMTQDLRGNDKLVADVTASIMQSAPSLAVGTVGGPALSTLFAQTALAEYNEGRNSGFDVGASLARGGIMGMAEAVGERFGFPQQIKLLRGVVRDMPPNELAKTLGELIKKEVPGEQLTTALQFMADKIGPAAQNPNATLSDYLEQAGETLKTTVAQTAVMGGGPAVLAQGRINDAAVGRSALTQAERLAMDKWGANPYAIANANGFRIEPPLVSDDARAQRSKTTAIFENAAASYGIPSTAVARAKKAAEGLPIDQVGPFYSRFVQALQKRNLVGSEVDTHVLDSLEAGPVVLPEERAAEAGDTKPAESGTEAPKTETVAAEPDYSGLSEPSEAAPAAGIDEAAHAAATSPKNDLQEPTPAQQDAGNYRKGHARIGGLDVSIENPQGSIRRSKPDAPVKWETEMQHHYGYIRGTVGQDGDHIDTFIKPGTADDFAGNVFVVDQVNPKTGKPDEHKVMLGFDTEDEARAAYLSNYQKGWKGLGAITAAPMADFKTWLKGDTGKPFANAAGTAAGSAGQRVIAHVGPMPNQAKPLELRANKDGTLTPWLEGHELLDFESGDPVVLPAGASDQQAVDAIKSAKSLGARQKFFPTTKEPKADAAATEATPSQTPAPAAGQPDAAAAGVPASAAAGIQATGVAPAPKKPGRSRALDPAADTLLQALAKLGGVQRKAVASEFGLRPEELMHAVPVGGLKGYPFRAKGGMGLDAAISGLREAGYLVGVSDADAMRAFEDAVHKELGGGQVMTPQGTMARAQAEQEQQSAYEQKLDEADRAEREAIMAEAGLTESDMAAVSDDDIDLAGTSNTSASEFMRAMGFTEEEIRDEQDQQRQQARGGREEVVPTEPGSARAADAVGGAEAGPDAAPAGQGLTDAQAFEQDYAAFDGKTVELQVQVGATGTTATLKMDAAKAMRALDKREAALKELRSCLKRAA